MEGQEKCLVDKYEVYIILYIYLLGIEVVSSIICNSLGLESTFLARIMGKV